MVKIIRKRQQKNRLHYYRSQIVELKAEIERKRGEILEELHVGEYLLYYTPKGIGIRHRSGEGGVFDSGLFEQKVKEFFNEHF